MALWCSGPQPFVAQVQELTSAHILEGDLGPSKGDTLLIDLDEPGAVDPLTAIQMGVSLGCEIVVACHPHGMSRVVDAVRAGATEVVAKPVRANDLAKHVTVDLPEGEIDVADWRKAHGPEIVGESPALWQALEIAKQAGEFDCPVLITGESGTGKELLAKALHRSSRRHEGPFIPVNCPAIPKELVESELFGHSKGAFTGATTARLGRFAAADTGTLFLDEIGEMELDIQCKLLRVLQDYQITPVGESRSQHVDVRVITATNRNLDEMASKGTFREDLLYRLNVVQVHLPALRERREDIPSLVDHFLHSLAEQRNVSPPLLTPAVRTRLARYDWPGNIRQLRNVIERLVILRRGRVVDINHLPQNIAQSDDVSDETLFKEFDLPPDGMDLRDALQRFEETMIRKALLATGGNKNQAAKILGMNRTTLVEKLRKRPLESPAAAVG